MKRLLLSSGVFLAWDRDDITRVAEQTGAWDAQLLPFFDTPQRDGLAVDLGANIGILTVALAQRFPSVLAVEAHPMTAKLLRENLWANRVRDRVTVIEGAAYDRYTTLALASSAVHGWIDPEQSFADLDQVPHAAGFTFVEDPAQQHHLHEWTVETVVLDELIAQYSPDRPVRLIKSDVQGADLRALIGGRATIQQWHPRIIFEYEGHVSQCRGDDWPDYETFLRGMGYRWTQIPGPSTDFVADWMGKETR